MTPQELKNSILQLAIQGKLVEQRPEEGVAEVPAAHKHGGKEARRHGEIEPPFDIPESWRWVRLGDCTTYADRKEKILPSEIPPDAWSLDLEDIEKDTGKIINHCPASARRITGEKVVFHKGQILYSKLRPYLKKILVAPQDGICTPELVPFSAFDGIDASYLVAVLRSPHVDFAINSVTYGVKMPRVGTETMVNLPIPLPPLAEQKRIVSKIEELLPLLARYEQAWTKLEAFNARFPADLQKSLLQLAIQGKLVEQRPEEGTGEDLYRQIQSEKHRLIQSGKIKKEKPLPEITEDEIPFDIPATWKWVRWGNLSHSIQYGYNAPALEKGRIKMVRISDIQDGKVLWETVPYCEIKEDDIPAYLLRSNDILFARTGGTVGKSFLVREVPEEAIYAGYLIRTRYSSLLCPEYMKFFMESQLYWNQLQSGTVATAQPNCNGKTLAKMILPLPPLAEQKRIVAKLEELLSRCDKLNQNS